MIQPYSSNAPRDHSVCAFQAANMQTFETNKLRTVCRAERLCAGLAQQIIQNEIVRNLFGFVFVLQGCCSQAVGCFVLEYWGDTKAPGRQTMPTIVVIEQDAVLAAVICMMLEEDGWQVSLADRADQGLGLISTLRPALVITDLLLPGMSGLEVCQALDTSADFAQLPIIVLSTCLPAPQGAYGPHMTVLPKPFTIYELQQAIQTVMTAPSQTATLKLLSPLMSEEINMHAGLKL